MLGPLRVLVGDRLVPVAGRRASSVLALLALEQGAGVSTERLLEHGWGREPTAAVRAGLYTVIRRLRVLLGEATIVTAEHGYALGTADVTVDAVEFRRLVREPGPDEATALDTALGLWRGTPFDGDFCDRLRTTERARLVDLRLSAVERRADLDLAAGRPARALAHLQGVADAHPLRESLWSRLLAALDGCGRRAEALERYAAVRARIADELGVDPGPELRAAYARLLRADLPGPAASLTSTGPVAPAAPTSPAGPTRCLTPPDPAVVPRQLPTDLRRFHGRADLLARLDVLLADAGTRPDAPTTTVVLHGLGGSGKTSAAVHWGHRVADRFPDGQLFVDLHGYGPGDPVRPATVVCDLLHALGVPEAEAPTDPDARAAFLRSVLTGRRVLLLLDNARDEQQVRPLLPGAGALVLVTSRSRLSGLAAREDATPVAVRPLPDAEAVRFLTARLPGVPVETESPAGLVELARRCAGLPLALAVAAQRVAEHPEHGLADLLDRLVTGSARLEALEEQDPASDLRAVLSWSYRALDPPTARFFRLLGVTVTPVVTAPSAAALTGTDRAEAARTLRRLGELNLVTETRPGRFRQHDLLAAYAAERCDAEDGPSERCAAELRMLDWYVQTVRAADVFLEGERPLLDPGPPAPGTVSLTFADEDAARTWFEVEGSSLPPTVELAARRGHHTHAARLAVLLWQQLYRHAAVEDAGLVQRVAVESARLAGLDLVEAVALNQLGTTYGMLGDLGSARGQFEAAAAAFQALDNSRGGSLVHRNLAFLHRLADDSRLHEHHAQVALDLAEAADDSDGRSLALNSLAEVHLQAGRIDQAREAVEEAIRTGRAGSGPTATMLATLGETMTAAGDPAAAVPYFRAAMRRSLHDRDRYLALESAVDLGTALRDAGRRDEARTAWQQALDLLNGLTGPRPTVDRTVVLDLIADLDDP